jgi:hypothetical protein
VAINIDIIRAALRKSNLKSMGLDDTTEALSFTATSTPSIFIVLSLQEDGEYLDARTFGLANCPLDSPHVDEVRQLLTSLNYRYRRSKFTLDPNDGEIIVVASLPLEDNDALPAKQLQGMILGLVAVGDRSYPEIAAAIAGGAGTSGGLAAAGTRPAAGKPGSGMGCLMAAALLVGCALLLSS